MKIQFLNYQLSELFKISLNDNKKTDALSN